MDPPSIHSNSVSVRFIWDKSHPNLDEDEFWNKLGTYDEKGNLICRVVKEIVSYYETSLVSHGADPFAQKIDEMGISMIRNLLRNKVTRQTEVMISNIISWIIKTHRY